MVATTTLRPYDDGRRTSTVCPLSGRDTGIERVLDPEFEVVSLDELETLVRNAWRRGLGPRAVSRLQSRALIRALLVFALEPASPVRDTVLRQVVWWELAHLARWGLTVGAIEREFRELACAIRETFQVVGVPEVRAERYASAVERKLAELFDWVDLFDRPD